jgi:hypothetical protein
VSAIVVVRAAAQALALTLQCLRAQALPQEAALSVVVLVADDDTEAFVAGQRNDWPELRSIRGPKDARDNGAGVRNLALAEVETDLVLWLEAGVCLPSNWLVGALRLLENDRSVVLAEITGPGPVAEELPDLAPPTTPAEVEELAERVRAIWPAQDPRAAEFALGTPTLPDELLPWALARTSAMLVRASLCREASGFDEAAVGWAGADMAFSFKLARAGATFRVQQDRAAVRVSFSTDHALGEREAAEGASWLFAKYPCLETEAFSVVGQVAGATVARLERLPMEYAVPRYRKEVLDALRESLAVSRNALLFGATIHLGQELAKVTHLLAPSTQHHERLRAAFPERVVLPTLGVRLPYEAGALDLAIVSDFFGGLSGALKVSIVRELRRVAKRVVFICSPDIMTHARASFGWAKTDPQMLRVVLTALQVKAAVRALQIGPHLLVEVPS